MRRAEITQAVRTAFDGSRKVRITFMQEAVIEVSYLLGMARSGIVQLNNGAEMTLMAVSQSKDWGDDQNRTTTLILTDRFDENWFVERMYDALEKIEAVR